MNYVSKYNKAYDTIEEFEMRLNNFNKVEEQIRNHQERNDVSHTLAHNQFSDWTDAEFQKILGLKERDEKRNKPIRESRINNVNSAYPTSWDWRQHNAVTGVKNQAACGSCWAFATSATLEGAHAVSTGQLLSFSEQQWVSCVKDQAAYGYISEPEPCCYGCNGGDNDASY